MSLPVIGGRLSRLCPHSMEIQYVRQYLVFSSKNERKKSRKESVDLKLSTWSWQSELSQYFKWLSLNAYKPPKPLSSSTLVPFFYIVDDG